MIRTLSLTGCLLVALATSVARADVVAPGEVSIRNLAVAEPLTGTPGDPVAGREAFAERKSGNCLACHVNSDLVHLQFHGTVGPALDQVAERWNEAQLRAILINAKAVFGPQTVMPGFYSLEVGANVREDLVGKTILSARQVEDIVAYLTTLR